MQLLNKLNYILKTLPQEGLLSYEYNPFKNYRLSENKYVKYDELNKLTELKGSLVDLDTDEFKFDLNHPVTILPQYSYDGSVNLILTDGLNLPRMVNSRFSVIGKLQYLIVDRLGNSDTNIYNEGKTFNSEISLYKQINKIPNVTLQKVVMGGNLPIGNYHFYFRYLDADGNYTDFVNESGLVSIFIGTSPDSIKSGFRDENSQKSVYFYLNHVDTVYPYIEVFYTRATSDLHANYVKTATKINKKYTISNVGTCYIGITGLEESEDIPLSTINSKFNIVDSAATAEICLNRLFLGNVTKSDDLYKDLKDLALRFYPEINKDKSVSDVGRDYNEDIDETYYSPEFIYNYTGYWPGEYYRFGVVFILSNYTLSSVYNIRGFVDEVFDGKYTNVYTSELESELELESKRNYLKVDEETGTIDGEIGNSKGIFKFNTDSKNVLGLTINYKADVVEELKKLGIRGLFFVRLTRIPTTICQALTIATDKHNHTPTLPVAGKGCITESFIGKDHYLDFLFSSRVRTVENYQINAAICPEYSLDLENFNSLFTGNEYLIEESSILPDGDFKTTNIDRHFYNKYTDYKEISDNVSYKSKVIGVPDSCKLMALDDVNKYSTKAGLAEEAHKFAFINLENKIKKPTNLLRGNFGPIIGIPNANKLNNIINIKIPRSKKEEFDIRICDNSSYFSISNRIDINLLPENNITVYRGDCYICQYTHRINRNFNDSTSPYNDIIVDGNTWKDNFEYDENGNLDTEKISKINLGDVNAVLLGMWATFTLRSNMNLCIRGIDETNITEKLESNHYRGFYPLFPINASGSYKIPESLVYNKGFTVSVSEMWNHILPYAPSYKNDFTNRIMYSDLNVNDSFKNGYRIFLSLNYKDYPKTYGLIIKLIELSGNLVCVFEHGVALIPINERVVAGQGDGGEVFINTNNILPDNPLILSDMYGSLFIDSIIKTPNYIYGVDTVGKKIWRTDGNLFEIISDYGILEFLNNNITLSEREITPILGIRNVKTFYNAFKLDVMFTYYDHVYGFEEKAWNLCFNERLNKFITFYSWIPSVMENIDNMPFSFDRDTSKYISKLYTSLNDGITISNSKINLENLADFAKLENGLWRFKIGTLKLSNRVSPKTDHKIKYTLKRDVYKNYKHFEIVGSELYLKIPTNEDTIDYTKLIDLLYSEIYYKIEGNSNNKTHLQKDEEGFYYEYVNELGELNIHRVKDFSDSYFGFAIYKDRSGKRPNLDIKLNLDRLILYLNIKADIETVAENENTSAELAYYNYMAGYDKDSYIVQSGYYESTIALISEYNYKQLSTDFWKHGLAGSIDIKDKIFPTYWYGKQHPFEFECIVVDDPSVHKIFTNLELISNKVKPESFHYEVIGDAYDFADDKPTMYFRLEALKALYLYNGYNILYDRNFKNILPKLHNKSAYFPQYYSRWDTINDIYDSYKRFLAPLGFNYDHLSGAEVVYYPTRNEFRIWNHVEAIDVDSLSLDIATSVIKANCRYLEDKWLVSINPIVVTYKNEFDKTSVKNGDFLFTKGIGGVYKYSTWVDGVLGDKLPPINIQGTKLEESKTSPSTTIDFPDNENDGDNALYGLYDMRYWKLGDWRPIDPHPMKERRETDVRGKFIKIRIRYSGEELAIIDFLNTIYQISFA